MPDSALMGTQGWKQFLIARQEMLDAYDRAREYGRVHEVPTYHGNVAEAELRRWLSEFLPRRYGITQGYVISQKFPPPQDQTAKAPHYDVIIYDQLESPVLWVEAPSDKAGQDVSRAIPAEHVRAVIEVKASLNTQAAANAIEHLMDLKPLMAVDSADHAYQRFLPTSFFCSVVFFELRQEHVRDCGALDNLVCTPGQLRGYAGAVILRGDGLGDCTGHVELLSGAQSIPQPASQNLLGAPISLCKAFGGLQYRAFLMWTISNFSRFAFGIVARLNGTYRPGFVPSMHGLVVEKPS